MRQDDPRESPDHPRPDLQARPVRDAQAAAGLRWLGSLSREARERNAAHGAGLGERKSAPVRRGPGVRPGVSGHPLRPLGLWRTMTWDRSAKNAALVFLAYLLLVG